MSLAIRAEFESIRRLAFGGISNVYAGIGTAFEHPARLIVLQNMTDATLTFSTSGIAGQDMLDLPSGAMIVIDFTSNKTIDQGFCLEKGTRIYVRDLGVAATLGGVSLTVIYGTTGQ